MRPDRRGVARTRPLLAGLAAAFVTLAAVAWWLADAPPPGVDEFGPTGTAASPEAGPRTELPPPPPSEQAVPLLAPGSAAAPTASELGELASTAPAPGLTGATVSGRVLDPEGRPVPDARVIFEPSITARKALGLPRFYAFESPPWESFPQTLTDELGRFSIEGMGDPEAEPSSTYGFASLVVEHEAYMTMAFPCPAWHGEPMELADLRLSDGVTYVGRAVDEHGASVPDVRLVLSRTSGPPSPADHRVWELVRERLNVSTRASGNGHFSLPGAWPGEQWAEAQAPGFMPISRELMAEGPGQLDTGTWTLRRGQRLSGFVLNAQGEPQPGVEVLALPTRLATVHRGEDTALRSLRWRVTSQGVRESRTRSAEDGSFSFHELADGPHHLIAGGERWEPAHLRDVEPGSPPLQLVLQEPATLLVRVVDEATGAPLPGASAKAQRCASEGDQGDDDMMHVGLDALSGPEASAAAGLPTREQGLVWVTFAGWIGTELTVSAPGHAERVVTLPGLAAPGHAEHEVRLSPASSLAGRVLDSAGDPVPGALIKAWEGGQDDPDGTRREARSDSDGRYLVDGLVAGDWALEAEAKGMAPSEPLTLSLQDGEARALPDLVLITGGRVSGRVYDAEGQPASAVKVSLYPLDAETHNLFTRSDATGAFQQDGLAPGSWRLFAYPGAVQELRFEAGTERLVDLHLRPLAVVRGRVTHAGAPVEGATITTASEPGWGDGLATTDALGEYQLELPAGTQSLVATDGDHVSPAGEVETAWGQEHLLDLAFAEGEVRGRVLDEETGAPVPGASVRIRAKGRDSNPFGTYVRAKADDDGRFTLSRVPPDRWTLTVSASTHQPLELSPFALELNQQRDMGDVYLARGVQLTVRVLDTAGEVPSRPLKLRVSSPDRADWRTEVWPNGSAVFSLTGVSSGTYLLEVIDQRRLSGGTEAPPVYASREVTLEVGVPQEIELLYLPAGG